MLVHNLAFIALTLPLQPQANVPKADLQLDSISPADTLPAVELADSAYYVEDTSGVDRMRLDSSFALLRGLLVAMLDKRWSGTLTYTELCKQFPALKKHEWLQPASFRLFPGSGAIYVLFEANPGNLPELIMINDPKRSVLEFSYITPNGASVAWAKPVPMAMPKE